jgi:hypothetical protein
MADASDYLEASLLNWVKGTTFPAAPTSVFVGLFSSDPTDTGAAGTEVTTTIRAAGRVAVTFGANSGTGDGVTSVTNDAIVDFENAAAGATVTHYGIFDAASAGNMIVSDALTASKTVNTGDPVSFPVSSITITVD